MLHDARPCPAACDLKLRGLELGGQPVALGTQGTGFRLNLIGASPRFGPGLVQRSNPGRRGVADLAEQASGILAHPSKRTTTRPGRAPPRGRG